MPNYQTSVQYPHWQPAYFDALVETDSVELARKISIAKAVIRERISQYGASITANEYAAMKYALRNLGLLSYAEARTKLESGAA
jgi:hypothetical protein